MKKLFLVAAIAVFGFSTMNGQIAFGAKAGLNLASVNGDNTDEASGLTGFHVGGVAKISVSEFFSVQPELVYSAQGFSLEDNDFDFDADVKLSYLNIPIMADFMIAEGLSLQGGPQIGINLSGEVDFDGETMDIEDVETLDIGAAIGAQYKLASNGLFFQGRYTTGLTEIFPDSGQKNGVISLSVGYMFN